MRSNVPIALSRRSAYRVCGVTGVAIDILLKAGACVRPGSSGVHGPKMLGRICSPRPPNFGPCDHLSGAGPAFGEAATGDAAAGILLNPFRASVDRTGRIR